MTCLYASMWWIALKESAEYAKANKWDSRLKQSDRCAYMDTTEQAKMLATEQSRSRFALSFESSLWPFESFQPPLCRWAVQHLRLATVKQLCCILRVTLLESLSAQSQHTCSKKPRYRKTANQQRPENVSCKYILPPEQAQVVVGIWKRSGARNRRAAEEEQNHVTIYREISHSRYRLFNTEWFFFLVFIQYRVEV